MSYLLDTNVVSEVRKRIPNRSVIEWFNSVDGPQLYLSVLVLGEIRNGVERLRRRDPRQAGVYTEWLATMRRDYRDRTLPITSAIAEEWGRLSSARPVPVIDGLLAATAKVHSLTLVTRNTRQLLGLDVSLIDPFHGG